MPKARAKQHLQVVLAEWALGYLLGGLLVLASDFALRNLHDISSPILDELTFTRLAFADVLLGPLTFLHLAIYVAAKCVHELVDARLRWFPFVLYVLLAFAFTWFWRGVLTGDTTPTRGSHALGFYLFGLPFLVLAVSHCCIMPRLEDHPPR